MLSCVALAATNVSAVITLPPVTLDFDSVTYTSGALSGEFDIDPTNAGADVRITFTPESGTVFNAGADGDGARPTISDILDGGTGGTGLNFFLDFASEFTELLVTIDFLYEDGVTNVIVPIFDVDVGTATGTPGVFSFTDELDAIQSSFGGVTTAIDTDDIVFGSTNELSSLGTVAGISTADNTGASAADGTVLLGFSDTVLTQISFTYENFAGTTPANPAAQGISLGDITFAAVIPEPRHYAWLAGLMALSFVIYRRRP